MKRAKATGSSRRETALDRVADHLTIISGFSELLHEGAYGRLTLRQRRVLAKVTKEARRAGLLFIEMLSPGRGQSLLRRSRA